MPYYTAAMLVAGEAPSPAELELFVPNETRKQLYWVAADGGYQQSLNYGIQVQAVLGDFDSQAAEELRGETLLRFAKDKDESDRNLALRHLRELGHRKILQIGGGGQRSDHFLAMIYDYRRQDLVLPKLWLTGYEAIYYLEAGEQIELQFGSAQSPAQGSILDPALISVFPINGEQTLLASQFLKWPLQRLPESTYSLSNWSIRDTASIAVQQGAALVFCPYAESRLKAAKIT